MTGKTIIAGCGYVGIRLGDLLAREGSSVCGIRRDPSILPASIRPIRADLTDPNSLASVDLDCEYAVYCAASDGFSEEAYDAAYVCGLRNFLRRLVECSSDVRRVVFTSSTGVYGQDDGSWVDEESPTEPTKFSGKKVLEGERILFDSGLPASAIRFGGIYGPGRGRLIRMVKEGTALLSNSPRYTNRIHREDCARSLAHILTLEETEPVYIGVDKDPCDRNDLYKWLAAEFETQLETEEESSESLPSGKRCQNDRLIRSGYEFTYPSFREGYVDMIRQEKGATDKG